MKVLTFTHLWPNPAAPNFGIFIRSRIRALSRLAEVRVAAPIPHGWQILKRSYGWNPSVPIPRSEMVDGIPVEHPAHLLIPKMGALHGELLRAGVEDRLRAIRREFDFDVIDAHWTYPDGYAAVRIGRQLSVPVVVSARGSDINLLPGYAKLRAKIEWTLANADRLIAVSGALSREMMALGASPQKVDVIPNGVDGGLFFPRPQAQARAKAGLPEKGRLIGGVGSLAPEKGFDLLLEALAIVRRKPEFEDVGALIVGDGPARAALESLCRALGLESHVRFVGRRPNTEVPEWLATMDVFCLASQREGWPNVVFEALACGKPVVATAVGGVPEILTTDTYGFLVRDRNPATLASRLEEALQKSWDAGALCAYARAHTWEAVAENVLRTLTRVVREQKSKSAETLS